MDESEERFGFALEPCLVALLERLFAGPAFFAAEMNEGKGTGSSAPLAMDENWPGQILDMFAEFVGLCGIEVLRRDGEMAVFQAEGLNRPPFLLGIQRRRLIRAAKVDHRTEPLLLQFFQIRKLRLGADCQVGRKRFFVHTGLIYICLGLAAAR